MIHWFPGHMHKAIKEIKKQLPQTDLIIEIRDARAPSVSENDTLHALVQHKQVITVFTHTDQADPTTTQAWLHAYQGQAMAINTTQPKTFKNKLIQLAQKKLPNRGTMIKPIRALVIGLPNTGKSSLINALAARKAAKTGNEPAVTKQQQRIEITKAFFLWDTPGIMTPSPKNEACGMILGVLGTIRDTALDYLPVAYFMLDWFKQHQPNKLKRHIPNLDFNASDETMLEQVRQALGAPTLAHGAEKMIQQIRKGQWGKISFEHPDNPLTEQGVLTDGQTD